MYWQAVANAKGIPITVRNDEGKWSVEGGGMSPELLAILADVIGLEATLKQRDMADSISNPVTSSAYAAAVAEVLPDSGPLVITTTIGQGSALPDGAVI